MNTDRGAEPAPDRHVYAHSMWRTGSTALARRFLDNPEYLVFYEPFHKTCGSLAGIIKHREDQEEITKRTRHPAWIGGYFDSYLLVDPLTEKPLYQLYDSTSAARTVYQQTPSKAAIAYLAACKRVADSLGRRGFFGFCRSGTQQIALTDAAAQKSFYLYREPRSQFLSYEHSKNPYFLPNTLIQLAQSRQAWRYASQIIDKNSIRVYGKLAPWLGGFSRNPLNKIARKQARKLNEEDAYKIFFLSYELTKRAAESSGLDCFTIDSLCGADRTSFEDTYCVSLNGLHPNTRSVDDEQKFAALEKEVLDVLGG